MIVKIPGDETNGARDIVNQLPYLKQYILMSNMEPRQLIDALLVISQSDSKPYNRQKCYQTHTDLRNNHILSVDDSFVYFAGSDGLLKSDLSDPVLTYEGCMAICGTMMGWYGDWLPRLLTWLIPIVLLVACMQYGNFGAKKYSLILILFGDPISSFNSLISTVELSNRCRIYASEFLERFKCEERFRELRVLDALELAKIILAFVEVRAKVRGSDSRGEVDFDAAQAFWALLDRAFPDPIELKEFHPSNGSSSPSVSANFGISTAAASNHLHADPYGSGEANVDPTQAFAAGLDRAFPDPVEPKPVLSSDTASVSANVISSIAGASNHLRAHQIKAVYRRLNRGRSYKTVDATLSLAFYIFQVIMAFFPDLSGATAPSGGRIGPSMLLSFILSILPLSVLIGSLESYEDTEDKLSHFMEKLGVSSDHQPAMCEKLESRYCFIPWRTAHRAQTDFHRSLAWSGGISIYRPDISPKMLQRISCSSSSPKPSLETMEVSRQGTVPDLLIVSSQEEQRGLRPKKRFHFSIAALPVILAFLTSIVINQLPPGSFSCRSLLALGVIVVWTISWLITEAIVASDFATGFYQWRIILAKDFIVALLVLGFIIANSCGLLNNCWCASGVVTRRLSNAYVALNPQKMFDLNNLQIYPAIIAVAFSLQFSVPVFIAYVIGKSGFREIAGLPPFISA